MGKFRKKKCSFHQTAPRLVEKIETDSGSEPAYLKESTFNPFANLKVNEQPQASTIHNVPSNSFPVDPLTFSSAEIKSRLPSSKEQRMDTLLKELKEIVQYQKGIRRRERIPVRKIWSLPSYFNFAQQSHKARRAALRKKNTKILGDMTSLETALPSVNMTDTNCSVQQKPRTAKSLKEQSKEMLNDMKTFSAILQDSAYISDPFSTINTHLRLKIEAEKSAIQ